MPCRCDVPRPRRALLICPVGWTWVQVRISRPSHGKRGRKQPRVLSKSRPMRIGSPPAVSDHHVDPVVKHGSVSGFGQAIGVSRQVEVEASPPAGVDYSVPWR